MKTNALGIFALLATMTAVSAQSSQPAPISPVTASQLASSAAVAPCPDGSHTLYCTPDYYFNGDVLIWARRLPRGPLLVNQYTGETVADFRDQFQPRWAAGPNITVGRSLEGCWNAEVNYFGLYNLDSGGTTQAGRAQPIVPNRNDATRLIAAEILPFRNFTIAGAPAIIFDPGDVQNYNYRSSLNNFELNLRKDVSEKISWLVGFRYLNLSDELSANLLNRFGQPFSAYSIDSHNNLFGGQLGAEYTFAVHDPLYFRLGGKAGLFGNAASQSTTGSFTDVTGGNLGSGVRDAKQGQVSFVGQANLSAVYEITPRFHIRGGYSLMFITGVATSPGQLTASDFTRGGRGGINAQDQVFLHGMNFGLEYHH